MKYLLIYVKKNGACRVFVLLLKVSSFMKICIGKKIPREDYSLMEAALCETALLSDIIIIMIKKFSINCKLIHQKCFDEPSTIIHTQKKFSNC